MRRIEKQPDFSEIIDSISTDAIGRNADVNRFLSMLSSIEGPFTVLIDSPWGDGKTFFVKTVETALRLHNPQLEDSSAKDASAFSQFGKSLDGIPYLPFYFNAWENDCFGNPLATLLACMAAEFGDTYCKAAPLFKDRLIALVDAALGAFGHPTNITGLVEAWSAKSLVESYEKRRELTNSFSALVEESLPEVANKMIVFIDELDRCRPDFAVKLLEQTKALFNCDNVILVLSTDLVQLSYALKGMYGSDYGSLLYLERFYDYKFLLTPVSGSDYLKRLNPDQQTYRFDKVVEEAAKTRSLTMRDCHRLYKVRAARQYCISAGNAIGYPEQALRTCVLPMLLFIEREDPDAWNDVRSGADIEAVYNYGKGLESFIENLDVCIRGSSKLGADDAQSMISDETRRDYIRDLCAIVFIDDDFDPRRRQAYNNNVAVPWGHPDMRIYRTLDFG